MKTGATSGRSEWLPIALVMAAPICDLLLQAAFHRSPGEISLVAQLLVVSGVLILCSVVRFRGRGGSPSGAPTRRGRLSFALAVAGAVSMLLTGHIVPWANLLSASSRLFVVALFGLGCWIVLPLLPAPLWARFRWAVVVACCLFVGSQIVLGQISASKVSWPAWPEHRVPSNSVAAKTAVIFLLLDELNATSKAPIVDALRDAGLEVQSRDIPTVGTDTALVVPAMFSGGDFSRSRACGLTTICGTSDALDFSKVVASRDDIDVVGFYMPYCAIHGLRSCQRLSVPFQLSNWRWWLCSARPQLRGLDVTTIHVCTDPWSELSDQVADAIREAPVWSKGGFLYAHVPLPHPPGTAVSGTLKEDYNANVEKAARLVGDMARRAKASGFTSLSMVIFSDHPLRVKLWCRYISYAPHPCSADDHLDDHLVPLIVAGNVRPLIDAIRTNRDVFTLAPPLDAADR